MISAKREASICVKALDRDIGELFIGSRTPGIVYEDLLIQGTVVMEGPGPSAPGHIRAYHIPTGEMTLAGSSRFR